MLSPVPVFTDHGDHQPVTGYQLEVGGRLVQHTRSSAEAAVGAAFSSSKPPSLGNVAGSSAISMLTPAQERDFPPVNPRVKPLGRFWATDGESAAGGPPQQREGGGGALARAQSLEGIT